MRPARRHHLWHGGLDLCQRPEFRCAPSHVFRPLDDRFVRGVGRSGRPLINGEIFRIRTIQWREQLRILSFL
jgi:hypothetical protein